MMVALQEANPNAFINDNINLLKQGVTLTIPDSSLLDTIGETPANLSIAEQEQEWRQQGMDAISP